MDDLASNGCADFDEFTAGRLFEDAIEDYQDQDKLFPADYSPKSTKSAAFWLNDAEYFHHESVACCVNAAMRSHITDIPSATNLAVHSLDMFDIHETNTYSVHGLEFLTNGSPLYAHSHCC